MVKRMFASGYEEIKKNNTYCSLDHSEGFILLASRSYLEGRNEKYWFGYRESRFDGVGNYENQYIIFICRYKTVLTVKIPRSFIDKYSAYFNTSADEDGNISHYHIIIYREPDNKVTMLLSKPFLKKIDITEFAVDDIKV